MSSPKSSAAFSPNALERGRVKSGGVRWEIALHFHSGDAATIGWITKRGGWSITEAGIEALANFPTEPELFAELNRAYREIDQRRKQAQQVLGEHQQFIADSLRLVEPGTWTAHEDLAESVRGLAAEKSSTSSPAARSTMANGHRVLHADGSIPAEGMVHASYRMGDLRHRLESEGVEFEHSRSS